MKNQNLLAQNVYRTGV